VPIHTYSTYTHAHCSHYSHNILTVTILHPCGAGNIKATANCIRTAHIYSTGNKTTTHQHTHTHSHTHTHTHTKIPLLGCNTDTGEKQGLKERKAGLLYIWCRYHARHPLQQTKRSDPNIRSPRIYLFRIHLEPRRAKPPPSHDCRLNHNKTTKRELKGKSHILKKTKWSSAGSAVNAGTRGWW